MYKNSTDALFLSVSVAEWESEWVRVNSLLFVVEY